MNDLPELSQDVQSVLDFLDKIIQQTLGYNERMRKLQFYVESVRRDIQYIEREYASISNEYGNLPGLVARFHDTLLIQTRDEIVAPEIDPALREKADRIAISLIHNAEALSPDMRDNLLRAMNNFENGIANSKRNNFA